MTLEGDDVCTLVWELLVADSGQGGVNTLLGGTPAAPGRIYADRIPQAAAFPAATIALVAAPDTLTLGGVHVKATVSLDVAVYAAGTSYAPIKPIMRRIVAVLDGAGGVADETYAYKLARVDLRRGPADDAGLSFRRYISTFTTDAHPAA